ncbi:MAG: pseudaminic acid biosynthesis-associated methylase [Alphaproteobacteria bacterium]
MRHKTEHEAFWAGSFGDNYIDRNQGSRLLAVNLALFSTILRRCIGVESVLELGANVGMNLRALHALLPQASLRGIEINEKAEAVLRDLPYVASERRSLLGYRAAEMADLVFTKTVLIHIDPNHLSEAYAALYENTRRYLLVAEYYNPSPVEVTYRGHQHRLFKRDFAGDLLKTYPDLQLVDYGFVYHGDQFAQDDITWFLMEKEEGDV